MRKKVSLATLPDYIDWTAVLAAPRIVGGHIDMLKAVFGSDGPCRAYVASPGFADNHWAGVVSCCYIFPVDGTVVITSDYFGSNYCCDLVLNADDSTIRTIITTVVNNARIFPTLQKAINFCSSVQERAEDFPYWYCKNMVTQLQILSNAEGH
jgi:hypothetical protein